MLVIAIIAACLLTTACPKAKTLRVSYKASYRLAGTINDAQIAVEQAYNSGAISNALARRLNDDLKIANGGAKYLTETVESLKKSYGDSKHIPAGALDNLNIILSNEVVTPILRVLNALGLVSGDKAPYLLAAIASIKTLIIAVSASFPSKTASLIRLENAEVLSNG